MINERIIDNNVEQGIAAYVDYLNNIRLSDLANALEKILTIETTKLAELSTRTSRALSELGLAKTEIENLININRGGESGIHGFIAEFAETGIRNARDVFQNLQKSVQLLNNNGPADILLNGKEVQMKFYANILKELQQASKYRTMEMMLPRDHLEIIMQIMDGEKTVEYNGNRLTITQINNIKREIEEECVSRGMSYHKWLKSSLLKYKEVQRATIDKTLYNEENEIKRQSINQEKQIKKNASEEKAEAHQASRPTLGEATKAAGIGAAVQGGLNLGISMYKKHKAGKDVWNYDVDDWKDCGIATAKGAIKGGVSGYAIYGLTNVCHLAAPSAGAITSGTFGLSNAVIQYRKGEIDDDEFIDLVTFNAIDSTGAAIGAAVGQIIVPIPVVGALIGSIVTTTALSLGKGILNKNEIKVIKEYEKRIDDYISGLDKKYRIEVDALLKKYNELGELQQYSFDLNTNVKLRFTYSIYMAKKAGVLEENILDSLEKTDMYFLS